jgi:hypothetical protein
LSVFPKRAADGPELAQQLLFVLAKVHRKFHADDSHLHVSLFKGMLLGLPHHKEGHFLENLLKICEKRQFVTVHAI